MRYHALQDLDAHNGSGEVVDDGAQEEGKGACALSATPPCSHALRVFLAFTCPGLEAWMLRHAASAGFATHSGAGCQLFLPQYASRQDAVT